MALLRNVLGLLTLVVVIYLLVLYFTSKTVKLSGFQAATKTTYIDGSKLPPSEGGTNYGYSVWFYLSDWNFRAGETKSLLLRGDDSADSSLKIDLAAYENNIVISVPYMEGTDPHTCIVRNFPLQKWVNLIVTLNGRTLDVYIDGKLIRTCILPKPAIIHADQPLHITPGGGFAGWTSNIGYYQYALAPVGAYNIYKEGPGTAGLFGIFEKYKLQLRVLINNETAGSFTI
jgi:hypothetical protein